MLAGTGFLPGGAEAVTCNPLQRGTVSGSIFAAGTTANHNDYRVVCTGDGTDRRVTAADLAASFEHEHADEVGDRNGQLVVQLNNAYLDFQVAHFPLHGNPQGGIVVLGTEAGADDWEYGIAIDIDERLIGDLDVHSNATITTTGGARGIQVFVEAEKHRYGRVQVRNSGFVTTTGGGASDAGRRGEAVTAFSRVGVVEVVNEAGGTVVTRGPDGKGISANANGNTAIATNRGTITTHGGRYRSGATGVLANTHWDDTRGGGTAYATNEATGRVTTYGRGSVGVQASSGSSSSGVSGTASIATNRGTVTTRGNSYNNRNDSIGVFAYSYGGTARARNLTDASISTYGTRAVGLSAFNRSYTGRADAVNQGSIATSGNHGGDAAAYGIQANSTFNSASAVNRTGATVSTSGTGARGIWVYSRLGSADEIASAYNRGTITTTGGGYHTDSSPPRVADGMRVTSDGLAPAVAENAYEGVIETSGTGARGLFADSEDGTSTARNRGLITTRGDVYRIDREGTDNDTYGQATGVEAYSSYSDATAVNEAGGVIETHGTVAYAMMAIANSGGTATVANRGRVVTRGEGVDDLPGRVGALDGPRGLFAYGRHGNARAENDSTGYVETYGKRAFGAIAATRGDGSRTSTMAEVVNRGEVHTRGYNADGVLSNNLNGTAGNPNYVRATNVAGATVTTAGFGASGLSAGIAVGGGTTDPVTGTKTADAHAHATSRNDGIVVTGRVHESVGDDTGADTETTAGDTEIAFSAGLGAANGVAAGFYGTGGTTIDNAGNATVINTGDVTVKHENAAGLLAQTYGTGTATLQVMGGSVSAEGTNGRGLWARTGTAGLVEATIAGGAEVSASGANGIAAEFEGGTTNVRLLDSRLTGKVVFGSGTDTFTVRDSRVTGNIDFGTGADTLNVHGDAWLEGALNNLETLNKRGSGNLVVAGDASFSAGANAAVENGGLVFTGQFNLGPTGTMTIHNAARLTAVLVDTDNPPKITAGGGITFDGNEELFVQVGPNIDTTQETTYLGGFDDTGTSSTNPIATDTPVTGPTGQVALRTARGPSTVVGVGHIPLQNGKTNPAGTVVASGIRLGTFNVDAPADLTDTVSGDVTLQVPTTPLNMSDGASGLLLGQGVNGLGAALFDISRVMQPSFAGEETGEYGSTRILGLETARVQDGNAEYWARSWSDDLPALAGGVSARTEGVETGVATAPGSSGWRFGVAVAPKVAISAAPGGLGARLDGTRYAVEGGWHGESFFTRANFSHGRYEAQSELDNSVAGGRLTGKFGLTQELLAFGTGARLEWNGMQMTSLLSAHLGAVHHEAHTANGAVFRADVPAYTHRHRGWRGEIKASPARWLRGPQSLRWRPALHLYTQRSQTAGPSSVEVSQRDKLGVLSFSSAARTSGPPRAAHGFNATVDALGSDSWKVQIGLAGMHSDGEYDQTLFARLNMRF